MNTAIDSFEYDTIEEVYTAVNTQTKPKRIRKTVPGTCSVCGKIFKDRRHIYAHMRIHTGERPFVCDLCDRAFNQSSHLKRHIKSHMGVKPFHCEICDRYFTSKQYYQEHVRNHTDERPYACHICDKRFAIRQMYVSHMRCHAKKNSFVCDACDSRFDTEWQLKGHMRIHDADQQAFMCDICKKVYARQNRLDEHLTTKHNIVIAFECNICHQRFSSKKELKKHYRQHGKKKKRTPAKNPEEKDIQVVVKQEIMHSSDDSENESITFAYGQVKVECSSSDQDEEMVSQEHTEQILGHDSTKNKFLCGVCHTVFFDVTDISEHLTIHADDEKPFLCGICKEGFWSDIKLKTHINNVHNLGEVLFKCFICEKMFSDRDEFKKHTVTHTTENEFDL